MKSNIFSCLVCSNSEFLTGDRRRVLLRGLTESLTEILPLLYSVSLLCLNTFGKLDCFGSMKCLHNGYTIKQVHDASFQLLEKHFGAALSEFAGQQLDAAKQHASTVIASLNAVNAYAEWAPVPDLAKYGLIHGYVINYYLIHLLVSKMQN